jgi:hypothetical protein
MYFVPSDNASHLRQLRLSIPPRRVLGSLVTEVLGMYSTCPLVPSNQDFFGLLWVPTTHVVI